MCATQIAMLVENSVNRGGLLAEHGLALWIEIGGAKVLFDSGQGLALTHNAERLGIPLAAADAIILSHGHYDHTGGLAGCPALRPGVPVFAHPAAFERKYVREPNGAARDIGMPPRVADAIREHAALTEVHGPVVVVPGLLLTGPVPRTNDVEDTGGAFFLDSACTAPDPLVDDQAAFVETSAGTTVILGCAHAGIVNTLRHVGGLVAGRPIHRVIGGMHLVGARPGRVDFTVPELRGLGVEEIHPAHCTGWAAAVRLAHEYGGRCQPCSVGGVIGLAG